MKLRERNQKNNQLIKRHAIKKKRVFRVYTAQTE